MTRHRAAEGRESGRSYSGDAMVPWSFIGELGVRTESDIETAASTVHPRPSGNILPLRSRDSERGRGTHRALLLFEFQRPHVLRPSRPTFALLIARGGGGGGRGGFGKFDRLPLPPLLAGLCFLQLGFKGLSVPVLAVLVQDVHQVGDVARGESQSLDLGQFGVCRDIRDALPELCEGRVDALGSPPLFPVRRRSALHGARVRVVVVHDGTVPRGHEAPGPVVVMMMMKMRVQAARRAAAAVAMVLRAVAWRQAVVCRRHVRVTDEPAREVRRPAVLVTAALRVQRQVVSVMVVVVMVHHRVVREARHQTHADTHTHAHTQSRLLSVLLLL